MLTVMGLEIQISKSFSVWETRDVSVSAQFSFPGPHLGCWQMC